jgi:hypothetical protein
MQRFSFLSLTIFILFLAGISFSQDSESEDSQIKKQSKVKQQVQTKEKTANKAGVKTMTQARVQNGKMLKHQVKFVDNDGDGFNDNAPDHDGDGIPNGQDADYDGAKARSGNGKRGFVDEDGDGINDNAQDWDGDGIPNGQDPDFEKPQDGSGQQNQYRHGNRTQTSKGGFGPGDGSGKSGNGPKDGTGFGPGTGSGDCDGTGPKSSGQKSGSKGNKK